MMRLRKWYHLMGILYLAIFLVVVGLFASYFTAKIARQIRPYDSGLTFFVDSVTFPLVVLGPPFYIWLRQLIQAIRFRNRDKMIAFAAYQRKMKIGTFHLSPAIDELTLDMEYREYKNSYIVNDWSYTDFIFTNFRSIKRVYKKAESYRYAIASFKLPRKLPNVFFDSKKSGGREFKILFHKDQLHSLEGDFDRYFRTYFNKHYKIDTLSFISPEVMEAIKLAKNYDVEIFADNLYLYSEFDKMPAQLEDMEFLGRNIKNKLLHNVETYRDERVRFDLGRTIVSPAGMHLKRSTTFLYLIAVTGIMIALVSFVCLGWFLVQYNAAPPFITSVAVLGVGMSAGPIRRIRKIKNDQRYTEWFIASTYKAKKP